MESNDGQPLEDTPTEPKVDAAFVRQTLLSIAGALRIIQHGVAPSAEEAKELEDRIGRILPFITPSDTP